MKRNENIKRFISKILALAVLLTLIAIPPISADAAAEFYSATTQLVVDNWSDDYIGSINLEIGSPYMTVDGVTQEIDPGQKTAPVIVDGRTLLPVRVLVEEIGGEIEYEPTQKQVTIGFEESSIEMQIDSHIYYVNDEPSYMDVAPVIIGGRTMLPIRAVTENLGFEVEWEAATKSITLTREFQTKRLIVKVADTGGLFYAYGASDVISGPNNIKVLQYDTVGEAQYAFDSLDNASNVVYVEPDYYIPPFPIDKGSVYNAGSFKSWGVEYIGADKYAAYLAEYGSNQQIAVAVVDTGIDFSHSFLSGRILDGGYNFVSGNASPIDDDGHGTHVSGTIVDCTAALNNIKILPVKVLGPDGGTTLAVGNGIEYAASKGVNVINMSLGGSHTPGTVDYIDEKIQYAVNRNVTVVVAAGNEADDAKYHCPAHNTNVITVAANDSSGRAAYFSNFGDAVNVSAPGVAITSCVPGGWFESWQGTSMASPHVAAAAAMYILNDPSLTPAGVMYMVETFVDKPAGWNTRYGKGIINMTRAIPDAPEDEVVSLAWSKPSVNIGIDDSDVVSLIATYKSGETKDVTNECNLYSADTSVALVNASGLVTGKGAGETTIYFSKTFDSTVNRPAPLPVTVTGADGDILELKWSKSIIDINVNQTDTVQLIAVYAGGASKDVTDESGLFSANPGVATVNAAGLVTGKGAGTTTIYFDKIIVNKFITLPPPLVVNVKSASRNIVKLEWSKAAVNLGVGQVDTLRLIATFDDGSTLDVTNESGLTSTDSSIATVSADGIVTGKAAGSAYIYFNKLETDITVAIPSPVAVTVTAAESGATVMGNTPGNYACGSKVAFDAQSIYYVNAYDSHRLYKMDHSGANKTRLSTHTLVNHISVIGDKVYYSYGNGTGICTVNTDGSGLTTLVSGGTGKSVGIEAVVNGYIYYNEVTYDASSSDLALKRVPTSGGASSSALVPQYHCVAIDGSYIYYSKYAQQGIFRCGLDGSGDTKIAQEVADSINVADGWIYYTTMNASYGSTSKPDYGTIYKMRLDGTSKTLVCAENNIYPLNVDSDGWIYFIKDRLGFIAPGSIPTICKIRTDGTGYMELLKQTALTNGQFRDVAFINGEYVYFTVNNNSVSVGNSELFRINKDGSGLQCLQSYTAP
ncbi:MAG: S8 family serine peptidase [Oscillospiraceae bacterium]|nr:S8 family serine peptidase [Oscillospiraceae bacterium]